MQPIVKGSTTGSLWCSREVQGAVCCSLLVYRGDSSRAGGYGAGLVLMFVWWRSFPTKGTVAAAAAGALHSFVANA